MRNLLGGIHNDIKGVKPRRNNRIKISSSKHLGKAWFNVL